MSETYTVRGFAGLEKHLNNLLKGKKKKIKSAIEKTAKFAAKRIEELVPVAFEELKDSIHIYNSEHKSEIVVDAPHAAAVEMGSRPHTPPIEPLIKWVKLKGAQGLTATGQVKRAPKIAYGSLPVETGQRRSDFHARTVARAIRSFRKGKGAIDVNAAEYVARAIQKGIMISGTKPTFFVKNSLPAIEQELLDNLRNAMDEPMNTVAFV